MSARVVVGTVLAFGVLFVATGACGFPTIGSSTVGTVAPMSSAPVARPGPESARRFDGPGPGQAPLTTMGLYQTVWDLGSYGTHGEGPLKSVYVQTVRSSVDRKVRLIVYLPGTHVGFNEPQGIDQILVALRNQLKAAQIRAIDTATSQCRRDPSCGDVAEVMMVGYSQGGLDAQALMADLPGPDAEYDWHPSRVTTVITFATPILSRDPAGVEAVHLQDRWDRVLASVNAFPVPSAHTSEAQRRGHRFAVNSGEISRAATFLSSNPLVTLNNVLNPLAGIHSDYYAYLILARRFEDTPASEYAGLKAASRRFQGEVIEETGWHYQDLPIADAKAQGGYLGHTAVNLIGAAGGGGGCW